MDAPLLDEDLPSPPHPLRQAWNAVILPILAAVVLFQVVGWLRSPSLPDMAPSFSVTTPEGESLQLDQFKGKTVVLNFWATWCGPCRMEAPSFESFSASNPDVVVLGLAQDRNPQKIKKHADDLGITYPVAHAGDALVDYGIQTFPTTVIIGPDGQIKTAHTGMLFGPQLWAMTRF